MLRHYNTSQVQQGFLNAKVAEAQKTLKDALYTADTVSKDQGQKIKTLEETVDKLNKSMDEMKKAAEELRSSKTMVDKALLEENEKCVVQERQNGLLQAKVTMLEENLATERETLAQKVADAEDKFTELAWYRMWVNNPDVDSSFLGNDLEKTLELWQARLKEEEEDNMSLSMAITKDDYIEDANSKAAPRDKSALEAEIDVMLGNVVLAEDPIPQTEEQVAVAR